MAVGAIRTIAAVLNLTVQICALVPLAIFYYVTRTRPHGYTLHQALSRKLMFDLMSFYTRVRWITPLPLSPDNLKERFTLIPPSTRAKIYRGPTCDPEIHPTTLSGTWYPAQPDLSKFTDTSQQLGPVLLHFHGGGYVVGSGRPLDSGYIANMLNRHVASVALFVDYRLSCTPEGRFPAALQDAISAYTFLLDQGIQPKNIILSGDSAGGHLVISLLKYIDEYLASEITAPNHALLWSPWVDIAGGASAMEVVKRSNYYSDYIPAEFAEWAVESFAPKNIVDQNGPYITLLNKPFKTEAKLWVHVGTKEVLFDEVVEWVRQMRSVGCDIHLRVERGAPHDIVESGHLNGFDAESTEAAKEAGVWSRAN